MQCKCSRSSFLLAARCATFVALVTALPAHAQQFTLVDQTYTANADTIKETDIFMAVKATGFKAELASGIPADLRAPTNYANGKIHVELDVTEAASSELARYTICLANSDNYACLPYINYEGAGKHQAESDFSDLWQYMDRDTDWSKGITTVMMIVKNTDGDEQAAASSDFYPYKAHVTMTVLAPGTTFDPDEGSNAGGAGGSQAAGGRGGSSAQAGGNGGRGGTPASSSPGGSGGVSGGANAATAGKSATGGSGAVATPGGPAAAGAKAQTPTGPAAGSGGTATSGNVLDNADSGEKRRISDQLENTSGCTVSGVGAHASSAWPLLALGLLGLRRRKSHQRLAC